MTLHRVILEMGAGNDLHGGDYTKAAIRAVEDALHHSSLSFIRTLGIDKDTLRVDVTIGVQQPKNLSIIVLDNGTAGWPGLGEGSEGWTRHRGRSYRRRCGDRKRRHRSAH